MLIPARSAFLRALGLAIALGSSLLTVACDGGKSSDTATAKTADRAKIQYLEYGRMVDVFAYRRIDPKVPGRLDPRNRLPVLVERDVLINPAIIDEDPFASDTARFRFLPYDRQVGHRQLLVLFDDTDADEKTLFENAVESAKTGLVSVGDYAEFQVTSGNPPLVPADAAIQITFDRPLGLDTEFFKAVPTAVQLLELVGDPELVSAGGAYRRLTVHVTSKNNGKQLILDPEVSGFEAKDTIPNPWGLPPSQNTTSANIRVAIPTEGPATSQIKVAPDGLDELNSVDVNGNVAVIRDFRAGNGADPTNGNLPDVHAPTLVARKTMGLLEVDIAKREIVVNKRYADLVFRGRLPFVDGPIADFDKLPLGPRAVPQGRAFDSGDFIAQELVSPFTGETVRIQGEVLQNYDIPIGESDSDLAQGGGNPTVRLLLSTVSATDSRGNVMTMQGSGLDPLGTECEAVVHYRDQIFLAGVNKDVGDAGRKAEFLRFTPAPPRLDGNRNPLPPNENISPQVQVVVEFSKPMSLASVRSDENVILANRTGDEFSYIRDFPKVGTVAVEPTIPTDLRGDGMALNMSIPLGLLHRANQTESYYVHVQPRAGGPTDRSGQALDVFDDETEIDAVTFGFKLDKDAGENLVGAIVRRFSSPDEDGTSEQDVLVDYFGQYQVLTGLGRMIGAPTNRFSKLADSSTLPNILRGDMGECKDPNEPVTPPNAPPDTLYHGPLMIVQPPNPPGGWVIEPHIPQGSRVQHTYREDDFQLSHRLANDFELDVEQLYWTPWILRSPALLTYDVLDRYTMTLGTAEKRPDVRVLLNGDPPKCERDAAWMARNGLTTSFEGNYLDNSTRVRVVANKVYRINPSEQFASASGVVMIGYPKFEKSYTWRDRRYVGYDPVKGVVMGLGGSALPNDSNVGDRTLDITTPWLPELDDKGDPISVNPQHLNFGSGYSNIQADDFKGTLTQDHNPIALPLLVDIQVWPDDTQNGLATGDNMFMLAGFNAPQPSPEAGFFNNTIPWARVQSSGGFDLKNNEVLVDPGNAKVANGGWLQNNVFGRFQAPAGDGMMYWAQADFVRKLSVVTAGYVDTLTPNKNEMTPITGWSGASYGRTGYPDFSSISSGALRPSDLTVLTQPSFQDLPGGTSINIEFRGSESFDKDDTVYRPIDKETATNRGNLLSPDFAEEQYRYLVSNRVTSVGLTSYVDKIDKLVSEKKATAPRFLNWRMTFLNNTQVTPARVPYLDFFAVKYRLRAPLN
ncbi:MAG: hypothetical protein R3F30_12015 [Planctomycetota bacterium]